MNAVSGVTLLKEPLRKVIIFRIHAGGGEIICSRISNVILNHKYDILIRCASICDLRYKFSCPETCIIRKFGVSRVWSTGIPWILLCQIIAITLKVLFVVQGTARQIDFFRCVIRNIQHITYTVSNNGQLPYGNTARRKSFRPFRGCFPAGTRISVIISATQIQYSVYR